MSPERWRQIEHLYHAAQERVPGVRQAFLEGACRSDESLRREVESLLEQDGVGGQILSEPLHKVATSVLPAQERFAPGDMVGPYRIVGQLGAGGMGEVYRAKDSRLNRDVALKFLPLDQLTDPDRRRRFLSEARAASALNHPN